MSKLDQALGDIIASKPTTKGKGGGGRGGRRSGGKGSGGGRGGRNSGGARRGGGRGGKGSGGAQRRERENNRAEPYSNGVTKTERLEPSSKVMVENLDKNVNSDDVVEIFNQVGEVKSGLVYCDPNGNSLGMAEITFFKVADAKKAVKEFHQAEVDGRPMQLKHAARTVSVNVPKPTPQVQPRKQNTDTRGSSRGKGSSRGRGGSSRGRGGSGKGRGGGKGGKGGKREMEKVYSSAELDADMDSYFNKSADATASEVTNNTVSTSEETFTGQPM